MTGSHRLPAVMADRVEPADSLDDFPTMPWATRALIEHCIGADGLGELTCWEPACGRGYMARPLAEYFRRVFRTDVADYSSDPLDKWPGYGGQERLLDFLWPELPSVIEAQGVDWIITNPPYRLAEQFVARAFEIGPRRGVALLLRLTWLEGIGRYRQLFERPGSLVVYPFAERLPLLRGRVDREGGTKTAYAWFVWRRPFDVRLTGLACIPLIHIPPCRADLEWDMDYLVWRDGAFHVKPRGETSQPGALFGPENGGVSDA